MASERGCDQAAILRELIELSRAQARFAAEGRIDELLETGAHREGLFARLDLSCENCRPELEPLARELAECDRALADAVQSVMNSIGARLGQVKTGMNALKAYGRY